MPTDYRLDPFTNTKQPILITNEKWTIPSVSPFTIRLFEVPLKETPSSLTMRVVDSLGAAITTNTQTSIAVAHGAWFSVNSVITIDSEKMLVTAISSNTLTVTRGYNSSTATTHTSGTDVFIEDSMSEVSAVPIAGQFWPDYSTKADGDSDWNTGTILFNSSDAGKQVAISYKGMGSLADQRAVSHGKQLFTSSGTFTAPIDGTYYITGCGPGGGGNYIYGGGAGACALRTPVMLIKGQTVQVTIGIGGTSKTTTTATAGGTTSFGSLISLPGGGGATISAGGAAGGNYATKGHAIFVPSQTGGCYGPIGGDTLFGKGAIGQYDSADPNVCQLPCGFGAGGASGYNGCTYNGANGFILVEW